MNILYEKETKKSVEEAIESITTALKKRGFGVLWQLDMKKKLAEHELSLDGSAVILEVCSPKQAHSVLSKSLQVGYFLPCKIGIFEREGKTTIGTVLPSVFMEQLPELDLRDSAEQVEGILRESIDAAV